MSPAACMYLRQQGPGGQVGGRRRDHPPFDVWVRSPDHVCQKRPEVDVGASRAEHRADLICRNHEVSKVDSQRDSGSVEAARNRMDTPDGALRYFLDRHDDDKGVTVTAGVVRGDRVLEDETCGGNSC
jgi:hypothetical protein